MISKAKFQISSSKVIEQYNKIQNVSDLIAYSVKSNPYIIKILEENTSSSYLIHNINELEYFKDLPNFDYSKILFMLHSADLKELNIIFEKNIQRFIVDNIKDLELVLDYCKKYSKKIDLLLRMRLKEHTLQSGRYFVYGFYSREVNDLINKLKDHKNIRSLGIHFHRKTQNLAEWSLIRELEDSLEPITWKIIDYLDIGGGIPVQYKNTSIDVIENIYEKIKDLKEYANKKNIKLIIEPGRAIAAPSGKLITTIKNIVNNTIFVDASLYNCSMDTIVTGLKLLVEGESEQKTGTFYIIKGATPASEDIFRYRVYFKDNKKPKIGDSLVFINAGAYIYYTDLFNLNRPKIEIVD
jgi:ornithine decarboxylase